MLDVLRKRKRSWVIVFLVGIIVVVFALWGVGSYINDPRGASVATINGEALTPREFELHYQRLLENYRNVFRDALTEEMIRNLNLRGAVLEDLIQKRLLLQEAGRLGMLVSDEELTNAIARIPVFQVNGRFSKDRYLQALRSNRLIPGQFEAEQREQLTIQRLYAIVQDGVQVTEREIKDRYRFERESLNLAFIRLAADHFLGEAKVVPEEIKSYYERNRESLKEPLRVQVEYLTYLFEHSVFKVEVSQAEIEDYYKVNKETKFRQPRAARLRHIFLRVPEQAEREQKELIRQKAQSVLREVRSGKDFAQLAKEFSEEAGAAQGGDIGWLTQGQMLPALDRVAFGLKQGEISDLLESPLGIHILRVEETREEKTKSLKEATAEIVRAIKVEKGMREAGKAVDEDRAKALSGADFSALAQARGIPSRVSPWFSRSEGVPEVGPVEGFIKTALGLGAKELGPVVEGPKAYYLLRSKGRREPSIPSLEAVRPQIEKMLRETKAFELAHQKAKALLEQLRKEKDPGRLAHQHGLRLEETGRFRRGASEIPKIGALQEVRPAALPLSRYQPIAQRIYTQGSAAFVLALKDSEEADMALFPKEEQRLRGELLTEKRQRALEKFLEDLKAKARIEISPEYLEQR